MLVVKKNPKVLIRQAMACKVEYWLVKQLLKVLIRLTAGVTDEEESSENTNQTGETEDQTNNQDTKYNEPNAPIFITVGTGVLNYTILPELSLIRRTVRKPWLSECRYKKFKKGFNIIGYIL